MPDDVGDDETYRAAADVVARLREAGFEAYFAGGCVRDRLLGRRPQDYDVATSARPEEVERLFRRTIAVGKAFGVVRVGCRGRWFETATFRKDGAYRDRRRPESVVYSSAEEDARRRDFTVNGMFEDPRDGRVVDFVGGRADLEARVLRAIGDPEERFDEDALRLLRAARFAAKEGFAIEPATRAALERRAGDLSGVAPERMREELAKLAAAGPSARAEGARLLFATGLLGGVFGPLARGLDGARAAEVVGRCPSPGLPLFLAGIFGLAVGPDEPAPVGRALAERVATALRLSNEETAALEGLLADRGRLRRTPARARARRLLNATRTDYPSLRELLHAEGGADDVLAAYDALRASCGEVRPAPLVDGGALLKIGAPPGKALGALLRRVRVLQLAGKLRSADEARAYVTARLAARP